MSPRWPVPSIRLRLTAWYTVVLCLMLVVYATATFVTVRHEFLEQLDDQLHDDFEHAESYLTSAADGRVVWSGDGRHDPDSDEDRGSDVWLASGEQVYRSGASASLPLTSRPSNWRALAGTPTLSRKCRTIGILYPRRMKP